MPGLVPYQTTEKNSTPSTASRSKTTASHPTGSALRNSANPEDTDVWLPSRIPLPHRSRVCQQGLAEIEDKIRTAQCFDALEAVRHVLRIKTRMVAFKNKNVRGQRQSTRSRTVIDRVHERARQAAEKYRTARAAKLELSGPGNWQNVLQVLNDADVRGYQDPDRLKVRNGRPGTLEDGQADAPEQTSRAPGISLFNEPRNRQDGTGETRRTLSWIWMTKTPNITGETEDETDEVLRTEWAKSRARAIRCKEEVMLLKEEMRRVTEFLAWKSQWWREREERRKDADGALLEGLRGYGRRQSILQKSLADDFLKIWQSVKSDTLPENGDEGRAELDDEEEDEEEGSEVEDGMNDDDDEEFMEQ